MEAHLEIKTGGTPLLAQKESHTEDSGDQTLV